MRIYGYFFENSDARSRGWMLRKILFLFLIVWVVIFTLSCSHKDPSGEALLEATRAGKITEIRNLLAEGANVNYSGDYHVTALFFASAKGDLNIVQLLLANGAISIETETYDIEPLSKFPLMVASRNGHQEVVRALLADGENVDRKNASMGLTALYMASGAGEVAVVNLLLEKGAKINLQSKIGTTAFMSAVESCQTQTAQILLDNGANPKHQDIKGRTALMSAAEGYCDPGQSYDEILQMLLTNGVNINHKGKYGVTALHHASYKGNAKLVKALLAKGANVAIRTNHGMSALDLAETEEVQKLLRK